MCFDGESFTNKLLKGKIIRLYRIQVVNHQQRQNQITIHGLLLLL